MENMLTLINWSSLMRKRNKEAVFLLMFTVLGIGVCFASLFSIAGGVIAAFKLYLLLVLITLPIVLSGCLVVWLFKKINKRLFRKK